MSADYSEGLPAYEVDFQGAFARIRGQMAYFIGVLALYISNCGVFG